MSDDSSATDLVGLFSATGIQLAVSAGLMVGFSILRPKNRVVYEPRTKFAPEPKRPQALDWRPTAWVKPVLFSKDNDLIPKVGLDAVIFLRFIWLSAFLFLVLTCVAIPLCIFHYFMGKSQFDEPRDPGAFPNPALESLSMSALKKKPHFLWVHVFLLYVFSISAYYFLWKFWKEWIAYRRDYFAAKDTREALHQRTLLITNLSSGMQSPKTLTGFLKTLRLRAAPQQVIIGREVGKLPSNFKKHKRETAVLEGALCEYLKNPYQPKSRRPTHNINKKIKCCGGEQVDTIEYCGKRLHELEEEIYAVRAKSEESLKTSSYGFASFESMTEAHRAAKDLSGPGAITLRSNMLNPPAVKQCPDPGDIIWASLELSPAVRRSRFWTSFLLVTGLTISWFFISSFVSGMTNLKIIRNYVPKLEAYISARRDLTIFLQSFFAPVLFYFLNTLPPTIFGYLAKLKGVVSKTGVEKNIMTRQFAFLGYQYIVIIVGSFFISIMGEYFRNDDTTLQQFSKRLLNALSTAFMKQSSFFTTVIATGFTSSSIELVQGIPLVVGYIKRHFLANTPRKEFEYSQPLHMPWGAVYADLLTTFVIAMAYALATPLILPFAAFSFLVNYMVYKYQLLYVYETSSETGGSWWPKLFTILCICIAVFQFMTLGAILVVTSATSGSMAKHQAIVIGVILCFTAVYWWYCSRYIAPKGQFATDLITDVDEKNNNADRALEEDHSASSERLEDELYNPALVKPLCKVWVWKDAREVVPKYYTPLYHDLDDYISKCTPPKQPSMFDMSAYGEQELASSKQHHHPQRDDSHAAVRRKSTTKRNAQRVLSHLRRKPIITAGEAPPELEELAEDAGAELPYIAVDEDGNMDEHGLRGRSDLESHWLRGDDPHGYQPQSPASVDGDGDLSSGLGNHPSPSRGLQQQQQSYAPTMQPGRSYNQYARSQTAPNIAGPTAPSPLLARQWSDSNIAHNMHAGESVELNVLPSANPGPPPRRMPQQHQLYSQQHQQYPPQPPFRQHPQHPHPQQRGYAPQPQSRHGVISAASSSSTLGGDDGQFIDPRTYRSTENLRRDRQ
ncbi:uncharacterized protein EV422DRAFT_364896 [Fimicolochytrium jonesii]|uniref:uncharacterized protein n=1 Tax=Fimicolochytrium jonesii TaxID=1396493 RepID=UPI0022FE277F|nr:uncharacterized protein EV422DRAFT_364896 [Fimicolochytrium jonesii]KAI8823661.1 hypothetical protein EV422DRAFT_364896 [Fimicolochytrium jonesii]